MWTYAYLKTKEGYEVCEYYKEVVKSPEGWTAGIVPHGETKRELCMVLSMMLESLLREEPVTVEESND